MGVPLFRQKIVIVRSTFLGAVFVHNSAYVGEWKNGKANGHGALTNKDGKVYTGNFKNGKLEGNGSMLMENGAFYEGFWKRGRFSEFGVFTYSEDDVEGRKIYSGDWLNNRKHGFGELVWNNNQIYEGDWHHGYMQGNGALYKPNGAIYDGEWFNNYKSLKMNIIENNLFYL